MRLASLGARSGRRWSWVALLVLFGGSSCGGSSAADDGGDEGSGGTAEGSGGTATGGVEQQGGHAGVVASGGAGETGGTSTAGGEAGGGGSSPGAAGGPRGGGSSGDGGTRPGSGGRSGSGGNRGPGGEPNRGGSPAEGGTRPDGGSSGDGGGAPGGAGIGGTGPYVAECDEDPIANACDSEGELCVTATHCCRCGDIPDCGLAWECARLDGNSSDCPNAPPELDAGCPTNGLVCQYCTGTGPVFYRCARQSTDDMVTVWSQSVGLVCSS